MADFHDHSTLIAALGGATEVATTEEVDTLPVNVRAWAGRNRIPPEYWPGFIALAARKNVALDADWLMRTTPARRRPEPAPAEAA